MSVSKTINQLLNNATLINPDTGYECNFDYKKNASGDGIQGYSFLEFQDIKIIEELIKHSEIFANEYGCVIGSPTPCFKVPRFARMLGYSPHQIFVKDESRDPSGSFKDRQNQVLFAVAKSLQISKVRIISSGNAAVSAAYYGARSDIHVKVAVPRDTSTGKQLLLKLYGADISLVGATYEETYSNFVLQSDDYWNITPGINPLAEVGLAAIGLEIGVQQPGVTDIVIPSGNGALLYGVWCGLRILEQKGMLPHMPRLHAVQIKGMSPLKSALEKNILVAPLMNTECDSRAESIVATESYCSPKAIRAIKATKGDVIEVTDEDIATYQTLLVKEEGLVMEFSAVSAFAACNFLAKTKENAIISVINCASGLKNLNEFFEV